MIGEQTDHSPSAGVMQADPSKSPASMMTADKEEPRKRADIYGSFMIGEGEFAIPVSAVQEVVNEPEDISSMPLAPPFMLGLFNLRGQIIPVVDLRILLEISDKEIPATRKVAIIEHGEHCIGLLFDKTGEVLNGSNAARVDFQTKKDRVRDVVIDGVLKFDNGCRLIQLLDPYELLHLERVPLAGSKLNPATAKSARGKRRSCISFQSGHTNCAIDLRYVKEVREMPSVDQEIFAHGQVIGTTNLRGVILPVIDFRSFMGDEAEFKLGETLPAQRKMLVLETVEGPIGMMVFSVDNILPYYRDDVLPFAKLALPRSDYVDGCLINDEGKIVMMLDQEKLANDPELVRTAKACQEIYPSEEQGNKVAATKIGAERRTFIRFTFQKQFALDTVCVSEVVNRPDQLLEPPYAMDFVEGIVNLRGELITLLNPRLLYGLPAGEKAGQKVLIFKHKSSKYGILVDSVDEIIMTTMDNVADLQAMDRKDNDGRVIEDIAGCLNHKGKDGITTSILVLDPASLIKRCMDELEKGSNELAS
ncbi:MAG: chemotaxis protein CheW [Sulfitobacter sp.]